MILTEFQEALGDMDSRLTSLEGDREEPIPDRTTGAGSETVAARIAELQARRRRASSRAQSLLNEIKQRDKSPNPRGRSRARRGKLNPEELAEKQEILLDVTRTDQERVRALRALRSQPRDSSPYSPEVVGRLVERMHRTESPRVRASIIRNLHPGEVGELKQPLLDYLRADTDPGVREEAAVTLEHYLGDPFVRAALNEAREHDPDEEVREQARETLLALEDLKE